MCPQHWSLVAPALRDSIRATYRPGQEVDKEPSEQYLALAAVAIADVAHKESRRRPPRAARCRNPCSRRF